LSGIPPTVRRPSRAAIAYEAEDRDQQIINRHFGFKKASTSPGEKAIDDILASCNDAKSITDFAPKGFLPVVRFTNIPTLEKQIGVLQETQKKRARVIDGDHDLVEKTVLKIKTNSIAQSKGNKVLVALIETHGLEVRKELKERKRDLEQRESEFCFMKENAPPAMRLSPVDDA